MRNKYTSIKEENNKESNNQIKKIKKEIICKTKSFVLIITIKNTT